jgi:hypothetical protein
MTWLSKSMSRQWRPRSSLCLSPVKMAVAISVRCWGCAASSKRWIWSRLSTGRSCREERGRSLRSSLLTGLTWIRSRRTACANMRESGVSTAEIVAPE